MKKILCCITLANMFSFTSAEILSQEDMDRLLRATNQDEFVSALLINPALAYDIYGNHTVYNSTYPPQESMAFTDFGISYTLIPSTTPKQDPKLASSTDSATAVCGGQSELINAWNESPGSPNVTQTLYTLGCSDTKSQTSTSTTSCGWYTGMIQQVTFKGFPMDSADAFIQVNGQINGSSQSQQSCSENLTYNISPTGIIVPAGCKAVVSQVLEVVDFSGPYTFSDVIESSSYINFTTHPPYSNKHYYNTGAVKMLDLVRNGTFPQSALIIESGNLVLQGSGTFKAIGFGKYSISYYYAEADPEHPHCNPSSSLLATQQELLRSKGFFDTVITQHRERDGRLLYTMKPLPVMKSSTSSIDCSTSAEPINNDIAMCWNSVQLP